MKVPERLFNRLRYVIAVGLVLWLAGFVLTSPINFGGDFVQTSGYIVNLGAFTGDITKTAGSLATTLGSGSASVLNSGNLADARMPNTAWGAFTLGPVCGSATFNITSARFKTWGKQTSWEVSFNFTALGSCTNTMTINLPATAQSGGSITGRENGVTGHAFSCGFAASATTATCNMADAGNFTASYSFLASGVMENQ